MVLSSCALWVGGGQGNRQLRLPAHPGASCGLPGAPAAPAHRPGRAQVRSSAEPDTVWPRRKSRQVGRATEPVGYQRRLRRSFHPSGLLASDQFPQLPTLAPIPYWTPGLRRDGT
jgi:hypothetical protein